MTKIGKYYTFFCPILTYKLEVFWQREINTYVDFPISQTKIDMIFPAETRTNL